MQDIVLFGASNLGKRAYISLQKGHRVLFFCDNDSRKWGTEFCGLKVISPQNLKALNMNTTEVIICSAYKLEIARQLFDLGIRKMKVLSVIDGTDGKDHFTIDQINIDEKNDLGYVRNKISLINTNYSGSSNVALFKLLPENISKKFQVNLLDESNQNSFFFQEVITSRLISSTHETNINLPGQIHIQLCHGVPLKATGCMSKSEIREPRLVREVWNKFDKVFSYSQTFNTLINACFGLDISKYIITGMPRNDFLFVSEGRENLSKLFKQDFNDKTIIYYLPTFRKCFRMSQNTYEQNGTKTWHGIFGLDGFDLSGFHTFLENNKFILIVKTHPFEEEYALKDISTHQYSNIFILTEAQLKKKEMDLYETLNAADVLITDYSSVFFDYLLLDRPILFLPSDEKDYGETRGFLLGPYDFWTPGMKATNQNSLEDGIVNSLHNLNQYSDQRKYIRDIIHFYQDAGSTARVWHQIEELLESQP